MNLRWLIALVSLAVPRGRRAEFTRHWIAELTHYAQWLERQREPHARLRLLALNGTSRTRDNLAVSYPNFLDLRAARPDGVADLMAFRSPRCAQIKRI